MEANCDDLIQPLESSSSDSSEFKENHEMYNGDGYNVNDNRINLISSFMTKSKRLACYSNTSDDESSDHLRPYTSIDENSAQFPAATHDESSVHNDRATSTDHRKPKRKLFPLREKNTSRKRKRVTQSWKKNKSALLREKGETCSSYSGEDIPKKMPNLGMLCKESCPFQCNVKFSEEQSEKLFEDFYKLNSKNALL
ncbi:hypothetical protein AVEN_148794-1 [Araneus ventricosus]|uniref:Uncharacterized protein n=1 Tax=Araneus ventricosus TaxID=182803 RepID=A0A4Y2UY06_ARAVE|nr:hypothetical protein AVEN_148794-1 [Araneus ventricosus]